MFPEFDLFTHTFISQLFRKLLPLTECFLTPQQPPADESIDMIRRTAQQKHAGDQSQIDNIDMKINENVSLSPCKWLSITPEFPLTECMSNWPIVQKGIVGNFYDISKWCQPLQLAAVATDPWSEVLNKHPSPWPRSRSWSTGPYIPILIWQPPPPLPLLSSGSVARRGYWSNNEK